MPTQATSNTATRPIAAAFLSTFVASFSSSFSSSSSGTSAGEFGFARTPTPSPSDGPDAVVALGISYATHLVGKWDVGHARGADTPTERGFDSHLGYYGAEVEYDSHELSPSAASAP